MLDEHRNELFDSVMYLYDKGLLHASAGNLSMRLETGEILITPSGVLYDYLNPQKLVLINPDGKIIEGSEAPSSESPMHLGLYQKFAEINAVVHTHSSSILALAMLGEPLPMVSIEGLKAGDNIIPITKRFAIPGSDDLRNSILELLEIQSSVKAVILKNHGLVAFGSRLKEVAVLSENLEWEAKSYIMARSFGCPNIISDKERLAIIEAYERAETK